MNEKRKCPRCQQRFRDRNDGYCRQCRKDYNREWERRSLRGNRGGTTREQRITWCRSWWAAKGQTTKDRHQKWLTDNADKQREHRKRSNALRKAHRLNAPGSFTLEDITLQLERQRHLCFWCNRDISGGAHTIDHYIPLARGGSNYAANIVLACAPCNSSKGNKMPEEFITYLETKRRIRSAAPTNKGDQNHEL